MEKLERPDYAPHNAKIIFGEFHREWKKIKCLYDNGLATDEDVYNVYHNYYTMAEVFQCEEEYRKLLIENTIIND